MAKKAKSKAEKKCMKQWKKEGKINIIIIITIGWQNGTFNDLIV